MPQTWMDVYELFFKIVHAYWPDQKTIREKVEDLYREHEGDWIWDEAWDKWNGN